MFTEHCCLDSSGVSSRVLATLLNELDGIEELGAVAVVAATNRPALVDAALLRPGRFDRLVYVGPPDRSGREAILRVHTRCVPLAADVSLARLAESTENWTGAELENLCHEASFRALRQDIRSTEVEMRHFEQALREVSGGTVNAFAKFEFERFEKGLQLL